MCEFPSWIVTPEGKSLWLTDEIIEAKGLDFEDGVGHEAIEKYYG